MDIYFIFPNFAIKYKFMQPERKEYRHYEDVKTREVGIVKNTRNDHKHALTCAKNRKKRKSKRK